MPMDDLYKALNMFKEGVTQYATQQAVNDATAQLQNLNAQALDEKQRLMANQQIGQELALRMTAAGSSPQQIGAATEGLVQSAGGQASILSNQELQASSQSFQSKEKALDRDLQRELFGLKAGAKAGERVNKLSDTLFKQAQTDFDKISKKTIDSLNNIQLAKAAIASNNPIGDKSVVNFLARASGEVGALTEADKAPFGGSQALSARIDQTLNNWKEGKLTPENRKFVNELILTYEAAQQRNLQNAKKQIASRMAYRAKSQGLEMNEQNFLQVLGEDAPKSNPQLQILEQHLLKNPNDPRRPQIEQKIKQLKGLP